mmetsp:Transcript_26825/g.4843  ORF Transcript_26825/g.4843 Transcript_26825/m.4843 type:complete len:148 (+) Transcript_26825:1546-1989(+)
MKLVAEVKCWEKLTSLSIMIPSEWHEIANYREEFRIIKESVLMVVTDYNNIMGVLDESEKKLFDYHLKYLNKKLEPGWRNNIDWNNKAIVSTSISDWRKQCTDTLSKVLHYKNNNNKLNEQYEVIANIKLLHLERKHVHECDAFEME